MKNNFLSVFKITFHVFENMLQIHKYILFYDIMHQNGKEKIEEISTWSKYLSIPNDIYSKIPFRSERESFDGIFTGDLKKIS